MENSRKRKSKVNADTTLRIGKFRYGVSKQIYELYAIKNGSAYIRWVEIDFYNNTRFFTTSMPMRQAQKLFSMRAYIYISSQNLKRVI